VVFDVAGDEAEAKRGRVAAFELNLVNEKLGLFDLGDDNRALGSCLGETEAPGRLRSALKLQKLSGKQLRGHHVKVAEKAFVCGGRKLLFAGCASACV